VHYQSSEVRIEFWCTARQVDGCKCVTLVDQFTDASGRLERHVLRCFCWTGVDMAVCARLIAEFAQVDLQFS
jgi:hypothetical protein